MSTLLTAEPNVLSARALEASATVEAPEPAVVPTHATRPGRESEPPEQAVLSSEEPELTAEIYAEAPDGGPGGIDWNDRDFRHGRSRG
jgi:hypothetical protein